MRKSVAFTEEALVEKAAIAVSWTVCEGKRFSRLLRWMADRRPSSLHKQHCNHEKLFH
jgi:hypothetical protein